MCNPTSHLFSLVQHLLFAQSERIHKVWQTHSSISSPGLFFCLSKNRSVSSLTCWSLTEQAELRWGKEVHAVYFLFSIYRRPVSGARRGAWRGEGLGRTCHEKGRTGHREVRAVSWTAGQIQAGDWRSHFFHWSFQTLKISLSCDFCGAVSSTEGQTMWHLCCLLLDMTISISLFSFH